MAAVICLCSVGAFSNTNRYGDIVVMFVFGVLGLIMKKIKLPIAPMVLGIVVGNNLIDANFRRAILAGRGSLLPFVTRPISLALVVLLVVIVLKDMLTPVLKRRREKRSKAVK